MVSDLDTGRDRVVTGVDGHIAVPCGTDRGDFPIVMQRTQGSASGLESQLASGSSRADSLTAYEHDKHAASVLATWTTFLRAWLGPDVSIIPVAPEHIAFVGAAVKMRGSRSFSNYISRAKKAHIAARHELEAAQGTRSVTRGQGRLRQSAPLPVENVAELELGFQALCQGGLVNPGDAAVLGSAFMLREIELAAARLSHVHVDINARSFSLKLPISKTDHTATRCIHSWSCVCDPGVQVSRVCPYHKGIHHLERETIFRNKLYGSDCA